MTPPSSNVSHTKHWWRLEEYRISYLPGMREQPQMSPPSSHRPLHLGEARNIHGISRAIRSEPAPATTARRFAMCCSDVEKKKRARYRRWLDAQAAYPSVAHADRDHYTCMALHRVASCVCHQCASGSDRRTITAILQPRRLTLSTYRVTWTPTRLNSRSADKLSI